MQDLAVESFSHLCRLCGEVDDCLDLFSEERQGALLLSKIQQSIRIIITQDDGLPTGVCNGCQEKLLAYSAFYEQCHCTQERLQEFVSIESSFVKPCDEEPSASQPCTVQEEANDVDAQEYYYYEEAPADSGAVDDDGGIEQEVEIQHDVRVVDDGTAEGAESIEFMEIDASQDLAGIQHLPLSAAGSGDTHAGTEAVIIVTHMDEPESTDGGLDLTDGKPKKKLVYVVKNASHIPVESVLSAVLGESEVQPTVEDSSQQRTTKIALQKRQPPGSKTLLQSLNDKKSQKVVVKGSDGKENMVVLDLPTPLTLVTEKRQLSEEVDDPTWSPVSPDRAAARNASWSKLKRARTALKNSVKTLRLPKPHKKREVKERVFKSPTRKHTISEDDPMYAVMMEKFAKPVSVSTLKRHGLYKPKENGYKINAPYKKDVAPYIEKVSDVEFRCKICNTAKFRWNYKAEIHILEHLDWRPFECDVCGRAFTQNQYLTKHKRLHFPDDTNFMCEVCGKGFQRRYYLTYHMDEHFERTYTCEECGRKFSRRQKHDEHVRYHHKCHYSMCDICGQTLRTTALSRHKKLHSEKPEVRKRQQVHVTPGTSQASWLTCNVCCREFRSVRLRDDHEAEHSNTALPFQCDDCNVFFKSKRGLNNHLLRLHGCITAEGTPVVTREEECEVATRVLDELSSTVVVSIPGDL